MRVASPAQRRAAALILVGVLAAFAFVLLAAHNVIHLDRLLHPCGLKQRYGLPCPTCGMTTATIAFVKGRIIQAFYIQPAAALFWCFMVAAAFLALPAAVFGVYFSFLDGLFSRVRLKFVVLALLVVILAGWAVTLARTIAQNRPA